MQKKFWLKNRWNEVKTINEHRGRSVLWMNKIILTILVAILLIVFNFKYYYKKSHSIIIDALIKKKDILWGRPNIYVLALEYYANKDVHQKKIITNNTKIRKYNVGDTIKLFMILKSGKIYVETNMIQRVIVNCILASAEILLLVQIICLMGT